MRSKDRGRAEAPAAQPPPGVPTAELRRHRDVSEGPQKLRQTLQRLRLSFAFAPETALRI
jgi:hypothetical protein